MTHANGQAEAGSVELVRALLMLDRKFEITDARPEPAQAEILQRLLKTE